MPTHTGRIGKTRDKIIAGKHFPWGKHHQESGQTHRLEHHCADVAACFEVLLEEPVLRSRFARAFGEGVGLDDVTVARLAVLTFLHDFGKVNAGFQFKTQEQVPSAPPAAEHIGEAVWACQRSDVIDALGLGGLARSWGPGPVEQLLWAALAHHGRPATPSESSRSPGGIWRCHAGYDPIDACRRLHECARRWFPKAFEAASRLPAFQPALPHLFAGTVALADQVGSNEELFPFQPEFDPQYIEVARARARSAVRKLGFARSDTAKRSPRASFQNLFDHESPRPLQRAVAEAPLDRPLLVLESETGSGKTEAAIWRFAKLWRAGLVDGLYFALPTRAAAVQLHRRVDRALKRVFPADADLGTVLAIPGYLRVGEAVGWRVGKFEVKWRDDPKDEKRQARWSAESARKFLAATAAVGTVDQALLSGLMVKWAHFRGATLVRSLLVVDEVHASDAYMTEVLRAVLRGHLDVGGYALLMSATLGCEAREALVSRRRRRAVASFSDAMSVPYPALTRVDHRWRCEVEPFRATGYSKSVTMGAEPVLEHPQRIAKLALTEARRGARVLVVRNTVGTAQAVFSEVRKLGGDHELLQLAGGPALHHSRFAAEDRKLLDGVVERALGKRDSSDGAEGRAGRGTIVVGTQTLEQSLDIDADVLIADLCPVDVLLQRMGRLHRHRSSPRPAGFKCPRCIVLVPHGGLEARGLARYGLGMSRHGGVYRDLRILELTRRLVASHPVWTIPEMNRMLVESATHSELLEALDEELGPDWLGTSTEIDGRLAAERRVAALHLLDRHKSFDEIDFPDLDERVRTRLGEDGPRITLAEPVRGPFGQQVATFAIPHHMFRGADEIPSREDVAGAQAHPTQEGLILQVGTWMFSYDREGIHRSGIELA